MVIAHWLHCPIAGLVDGVAAGEFRGLLSNPSKSFSPPPNPNPRPSTQAVLSSPSRPSPPPPLDPIFFVSIVLLAVLFFHSNPRFAFFCRVSELPSLRPDARTNLDNPGDLSANPFSPPSIVTFSHQLFQLLSQGLFHHYISIVILHGPVVVTDLPRAFPRFVLASVDRLENTVQSAIFSLSRRI